jgi:DNA-directed RNA polymerase specialized sigma24 family protein
MLEQMKDQGLLEEVEAPPIPAVVHLPGNRNILRADLEEGIRCLPPRERLVFLLMDVEGYGPDRIADLLEMEASDVVRTAVRARIRLRAELASIRQTGQCAA